MTENNKEKPILNFGIYGRFSSDNQNDKSSADQIYECRERVEERNGRVVSVYKDDAITGSVKQRPEYQRLLADIRDRKFDVLIAESTSRICRNQAEFHFLKDLLKFHGISLATIREGDNLSGIELTFKAYMDEQYREDLIAVTKRGLRGRAREGIYIGRPPLGYKRLQEIDPLTGEMVKESKRPMASFGIVIAFATFLKILFIREKLSGTGVAPTRTLKQSVWSFGTTPKTSG